jgi:D-tyrosyl-tRNA(Tyr) deacylase
VIQRVINAGVSVNGILKGSIKSGLLIYLGVAQNDIEKDADWLADKIINLRIFNDNNGIMNLSLKDIIVEEPSAGILVISQFTLLADARKGRRPSWNGAAPPEKAEKLYQYFINKIKEQGILCEHGEFQAHMKVTYTNDGPVTILLDSNIVN